jgi:FkbM family methyltransferase
MQRLLEHLRTKGVAGYLRYKREKIQRDRAERQHALAFYGQFVRRGDLCFDVGAHKGGRTEWLLRLGARVVCVEPQPICANLLRRRFRRKPVTVVESAAGDAEGTATLMVSSLDVVSTLSQDWIQRAGATGRFGAAKWDEKVQVPVTTLDKLIQQHGVPQFVKIDVEGFELQVLRGLTRTAGSISFEFVGDNLEVAQNCLSHLEKLKYGQFNYSTGESLSLASPAWINASGLMGELKSRVDAMGWGDIYARSDARGVKRKA